jgi:Zn-dependent protease
MWLEPSRSAMSPSPCHDERVNWSQRFSDDPLGSVLFVLALFVSVVIHEYGHALAAIWQGDDTPTKNGRFDWNPFRYLDGVGILLFVIVGFGWLGSVKTNPDKYRSPVMGSVIVSMAGIAMNLACALVVGLALRLVGTQVNPSLPGLEGLLGEIIAVSGYTFSSSLPDWATYLLAQLFMTNIMLAVFNAIPIPPLDGGHALAVLEPRVIGALFNTLIFRMGAVLILVMIFSPAPLWRLIGGMQAIFTQLLQ